MLLKPKRICLVREDRFRRDMIDIWDRLEQIPQATRIELNDLMVNMAIDAFSRGLGAGIRLIRKRQSRKQFKERG